MTQGKGTRLPNRMVLTTEMLSLSPRPESHRAAHLQAAMNLPRLAIWRAPKAATKRKSRILPAKTTRRPVRPLPPARKVRTRKITRHLLQAKAAKKIRTRAKMMAQIRWWDRCLCPRSLGSSSEAAFWWHSLLFVPSCVDAVERWQPQQMRNTVSSGIGPKFPKLERLIREPKGKTDKATSKVTHQNWALRSLQRRMKNMNGTLAKMTMIG